MPSQRTGGLVWIWQQPPKLQAGGSNPLLFAILCFNQSVSGFLQLYLVNNVYKLINRTSRIPW